MGLGAGRQLGTRMTRAGPWLLARLLCVAAGAHATPTMRSFRDSDGDDVLLIMFILVAAIFGALAGICAVFVVFYVATQVVQRVRRAVLGLDEDGVSERMRRQLLSDDDSRQSYELGRAFERQYPYGSVNTQLTADQQTQIRERGVDAWEFVVSLDVNAMLQSRTEVLFMGGENCVQTNLPLPKNNSVYYFEMKIVEKPADVSMWIGLATKPYPAWRMTGWNRYSAGYCTNTGRVHQNSPFQGTHIGEQLLVGDILGVGYQPRSGIVWFTRNGRRYKEIVSGMLYDLFPTVSADGPCSFSANFGQRGFVFIEANVKRWGLGPIEGALQPPPIYGADQNTILLEVAATPSDDDADTDEPADTVIQIDTAAIVRPGVPQPSPQPRPGRDARSRAAHRPPLYQKEDPIAAQLLEAGATSLVPAAGAKGKQGDSSSLSDAGSPPASPSASPSPAP
ncbi:Protein ssh4 [Coemansia nantahalensis]|nr:Protein ssh4 [Coemansia nantahalensis]